MQYETLEAALSCECSLAAHGAKQTHEVVSISDIVFDAALWVRARLDLSAVRRYRDALRAERELPPVILGRVDGALFVADGWHRLDAARQEQLSVVTAVVRDMKRAEVAWTSAECNLSHGVPLKRSERRRVFSAYVAAGMHRLARGRYKTYRDMSKELSTPFSTIRNWMREDHRAIYDAIGDKCPSRSGPQEPGLYRASLEQHFLTQVCAAMTNARGLAAHVEHPVLRGEMVALARTTLDELMSKPYAVEPPVDHNPHF
jgi:hypothetical protein